jgi:hypothetical protein
MTNATWRNRHIGRIRYLDDGVKWQTAGEHFVEHNAQGKDVGPPVQSLVALS